MTDADLEETSVRATIGGFLLVFCLAALSIAVFNWGLQYKMSLYQQSNSHSVTSTAKLWTSSDKAAAVTSPEMLPVRVTSNESMVAPVKVVRAGISEVPKRRQIFIALAALFFRPPPVIALA